VTRFMARHPLLAAVPLLAANFGILLVAMLLLYFWLKAGDKLFVVIWYAANVACCFAVSFVLVLLRRRSGLSARPLWALVVTLVAQTAVHIALCLFVLELVETQGNVAAAFREVFGATFWLASETRNGLVLAGLGALAGLLMGLGVARWKLRTGRWETIVPVDAANARGGTP